MIEKINNILTAKDILDKSFKKAKKKQITDKNIFYKKKKTIIAQTESFSKTIVTTLEGYSKNFPSLDKLSFFYQELINIKLNSDRLKKSLGAVNWAAKTSNNIYLKQNHFLKKSNNLDFLKQKQTEIYGRISSVVKQIDKDLIFLIEAQKIINKFPEITDAPTIVIAGSPNVGKSSLLRTLSRSKPKIAQYPFTTKDIYVGHFEVKDNYLHKKIQIIDTPGLLDRPEAKKNQIEKLAIAALTHLADVIIFIFDISESCGYLLEDQKKLLLFINKLFDKSSIIIVENKSDIIKSNSNNLRISNKTGEGIDILKNEIIKKFSN